MLTPILAPLAALVAAPLLYRKLRQRRLADILALTGPDAIAESRFIRLGGVDQWIGIRGEARHNPILLILHGGPGCPYSIFNPVIRPWERHFTIVQWDRRGVGKTLGRTGKAGTGALDFPTMVADAVELSEHLHTHLPGARQIVLGGSMGNLVGIPLVQRRPDLFAAYVATDLGADPRSEALTWHRTRERLLAAHDRKAVAILDTIGPDPTHWSLAQWNAKQRLIMRSDPRMRAVGSQLLLPLIFTAPDRSLRDVFDLLQGLDFAAARLFSAYIAREPPSPRHAVPFFLFQGDADPFTPTDLATAHFAAVEAPHKQLALIHEAGHFAAFTRPEQFLHELLTRVRPFALPT